MVNNTIKIIIRQMMRNKSFSLINITGLAVGMASCVYILLYVHNELSYDRYHSNADHIYRVTTKTDNPEAGYQVHFARCWQNWIYKLKEDVPEIEELVRFGQDRRIVRYKENSFYENRFYRADANVFKVFDYELKQGNPGQALKESNSIVITESMAVKYFGDEDPMGKTITTNLAQGNAQENYKVTGVMEDTPLRSHFHIDFLASIPEPEKAVGWYYTYMQLKPGTIPDLLEFKFPDIIKKYEGPRAPGYVSLILQKLTDIHLYSNLDREIEPNGNITYIYIFLIVAFLILVIACINFMNLTTARWSKRAKDIGVRKVLGAQRTQLIQSIFIETFIFCGAALLLSVLLMQLVFPLVNSMVGIELSFNIFNSWLMLLILIGIVLISGLLSGIYPALFLTRFEPIRVLKTGLSGIPVGSGSGNINLRKLLVVVQFSISIAFIIGTLVIRSQMEYIQNKNLGFSKDQTIAIRNIPDQVKDQYKTLKNELLKLPAVKGVTAAMDEPSKEVLDGGFVEAEGMVQDPESQKIIHALPVDGSIIDVMEMEMAAGGKFAGELSNKTNGEYILNESAVRFIGWKSPEEAVGKRFNIKMSVPDEFQPGAGRVVGVIKDFNYTTLKKNVKPLVLFQKTTWLFCVLIKVRSEDMTHTLAAINKTWTSMFPDCPMQYEFLDELFAALYRAEEKQNSILTLFSFMAIGIACLGLFGLAAYATEQRTKEIGIRKVMGASIPSLVLMLSREFTKWVLFANLIAWPAAYYLMDQWLQQFAYRTDLRYGVFIIAGLLALLIAVATIIGHTLKAAMATPVNSIRYE
jgi:putative ABC transport system permease protein